MASASPPLLVATVVFHVSMFVLIERALVLRAGWGVHAHPRHYFIVAIALRYAPGAFLPWSLPILLPQPKLWRAQRRRGRSRFSALLRRASLLAQVERAVDQTDVTVSLRKIA